MWLVTPIRYSDRAHESFLSRCQLCAVIGARERVPPASMVPPDKSFNAPAAARSLPQLGPRIGLIQNDSGDP